MAATGPDQLRLARRAEELGYDMIGIPEHLAIPPDDQHTGHFWLHSTTAQAALAGNLCRCGTYGQICAAVARVAKGGQA